MRHIRRRSVAAVCIALVVCAAILPGFGGAAIAVVEPAWIFVPDTTVRVVPIRASASAEQLVSLQSSTPVRGPPLSA